MRRKRRRKEKEEEDYKGSLRITNEYRGIQTATNLQVPTWLFDISKLQYKLLISLRTVPARDLI